MMRVNAERERDNKKKVELDFHLTKAPTPPPTTNEDNIYVFFLLNVFVSNFEST